MLEAFSGAAATSGENHDDKFYWKALTQEITLKYTSTAGTTTGHLSVHIHKHRVARRGKELG